MPHYSRAPIAEAVIDLQVSFGDEGLPDIDRVEKLADVVGDGYTERQEMNAFNMEVSVGGEANTSHRRIGFRLNSESGGRVLQLRQTGMSLSHLHPYSDWKTFSAELLPLWRTYVEQLRPAKVTRLAVRYINRINVPSSVNLDVYLNLTPRQVEGIGHVVEGYFMQLVLPQSDLGPDWKAILNTGIEGGSVSDSMTVLLDIDVFCTASLPTSDADVGGVLEQLRNRKNAIFEACITDEVRSLIE